MSRRDCPFWAEPRVDYHVGRWLVGWKIRRIGAGIDDVGESDVVSQLGELSQETVLGEVDGLMLGVRG